MLPALAFVAVRFLRDASLRHIVWLTAFGTLLIFPLASLIVPPVGLCGLFTRISLVSRSTSRLISSRSIRKPFSLRTP